MQQQLPPQVPEEFQQQQQLQAPPPFKFAFPSQSQCALPQAPPELQPPQQKQQQKAKKQKKPKKSHHLQEQPKQPKPAPKVTPAYDFLHEDEFLGTRKASRIDSAQARNDKDKPLVSVIITIFNGSSYATLFRTVAQVAPAGRVAVYQMQPQSLEGMLDKMKKPTQSIRDSDPAFIKIVDAIYADMASLDPENVVFNWECCSSFSSSGFPGSSLKIVTMDLVQLALERKHMVMFSDFALKALLNDWSVQHLGPRPFAKIGEFTTSFDLKFDPATLKKCASAQLTKVGELCENGEATLHALSGTLAFGVDHQIRRTDLYTVEVLTVATRLGSLDIGKVPDRNISKIGDHKGLVGHAIVHYATGGKMLLSAGHWIELSRLDVSAETLIKVAETNYGASFKEEIEQELKVVATPVEREKVVQKYACLMVQQSAPCQYQQMSPWTQSPQPGPYSEDSD